jgi:hypothetical protein
MKKSLLLLFFIVFACKSSTTIPKDWKKIETDFFSFYAPKNLQDTLVPYREEMLGRGRVITCSDSSINILVGLIKLEKTYIDVDSPTVLDAAFGGVLKGYSKGLIDVEFTDGKYFDIEGYKVREHEFTSKTESGKTVYHKSRIYMNVGNVFTFHTFYNEDKADKVEDFVEPFLGSIVMKKVKD